MCFTFLYFDLNRGGGGGFQASRAARKQIWSAYLKPTIANKMRLQNIIDTLRKVSTKKVGQYSQEVNKLKYIKSEIDPT